MASALFHKALEFDSKNIEYHLYLAAYLAKSKQYKEALKLINDALELDSNHHLSKELGRRIMKSMEDDGLAVVPVDYE